jgi:hypothetical protein
MLLNCYNLPSGFEFRVSGSEGGQQQFNTVFGDALHLDYDFEAKYAAMEPALAKEYRINQLLQFSQMWAQDPSVNQYEFKRAVFELLDWAQPERFLTDPKQLAQMQQQQQQMAIMPQLLEQKHEQQLNLEDNKTKLIAQTLEAEDNLKLEKIRANAKAKTEQRRERQKGGSTKSS